MNKEKNKRHHTERKYLDFSTDSPVAEAYRVLRTNIEFSSSVNPIKTVLLTSAVSGEGKSTTATNLGKIFAIGGTKTLIIDFDLRKPVVHKILKLDNEGMGISAYIRENKTLDEIIVPTGFENLYAITCDEIPLNPAEVLSSEKIAKMVEELREKFDLIIFDSPPASSLADAGIVSRMADATIIVVSAGDVTYSDLEVAKNNLANAGAKILGIVMNNMTKTARGYKYYKYKYKNYYRYGYGYGYGYGKEER